jgi:hypothetical protein
MTRYVTLLEISEFYEQAMKKGAVTTELVAIRDGVLEVEF